MIETSVVHSIDDIPPADWERVCTGDPLWQRAPFSTYERAGFGADGMCYLVVREGRELLSIVPLFWFGRYPLDIGGGGALDRIAAAVRKLFPRFFAVRILFAGNPIGTGWP
ncbi:MAG TPA: hypothetical protein VG323_04835, partial [Thermoanaerobaculia bacterium]|nr:hypothetical protein [Thermoanaerobaculia bacterium]